MIDWFLTHVDIYQTQLCIGQNSCCLPEHLKYRTDACNRTPILATEEQTVCAMIDTMCKLVNAGQLMYAQCTQCEEHWYTTTYSREKTAVYCEKCRCQ